MKIILAILALVFLNSCALIKSKEEKELEILSKKIMVEFISLIKK
ncbi:hypothetical protein [Campylobacter taeniopygiae]